MDERTIEIVRRFHQSWEQTEQRFYDLVQNYTGFESLQPLLLFIRNLKQKGENNFFRLGTSMYALIISRSVNHGLREDQKYIKIEAWDNNKFEIALMEGGKIYRQYIIDSLDDIRLTKLLRTLKDTLVD